MKLVKTKDNSYTFFSEKYQETYHSISGALEEAEKKFVLACGIKPGMNVLDIGFGLGYNSGMAILKGCKLRIIGLEKDPNVLKEIQKIKVPYWFASVYEIIKKAAANLEYKDRNVEINILLGDARERIKSILTVKEENRFDAVFLDPFSLPKNPELWKLDFFKEIRKRMKKNAVLATYSCARIVRENLKNAGFAVKDGPVVGRRAPGTIAVNALG